jgi:hypothetical protein
VTGYPTSIGFSDETSISILGHDLARELMGQVSFGEMAFWLVAMRRPTSGELVCLEAVWSLADHGLTVGDRCPAHLTGAPESAGFWPPPTRRRITLSA